MAIVLVYLYKYQIEFDKKGLGNIFFPFVNGIDLFLVLEIFLFSNKGPHPISLILSFLFISIYLKTVSKRIYTLKNIDKAILNKSKIFYLLFWIQLLATILGLGFYLGLKWFY